MDELSYAIRVVPAIVGLVTLIRNAGLPSRYAPLLAVVCGFAVGIAAVFANPLGSTTEATFALLIVGAGNGIILGLAAAQAYQQTGNLGEALRSRFSSGDDPGLNKATVGGFKNTDVPL